MASADSAAVVEKIVMATCSLRSKSAGLIQITGMPTCPHTEGTMVHEAPEPGVGHPEGFDRVTRAGDDFFQDASKDISNNLEEELTDEDGLRTEVLCIRSIIINVLD